MNFRMLRFLVGVCIVALGSGTPSFSQQNSRFTQYMYNTTIINPAYAGSRDVLSVFGRYRNQWVGLDGAPKTAILSFHTPINDSRIGLGASIASDQIGIMDANTVAVDLSYTIDFDRNYKLSFGIKGSGKLLNVDYTKLNIYDPNDVQFKENINNQFTPNIGAGIYLYSTRAYLGLSVPNFLDSNGFDNLIVSTLKRRMDIYLIGGYVFDLDSDLKFKSAFLIKEISGVPVQVDLMANFLMYDKVTFGVAYHWHACLSGLVGFQISDEVFIGYSYEAEETKLKNYSGSHEIFLRIELFKPSNRIIRSRFF